MTPKDSTLTTSAAPRFPALQAEDYLALLRRIGVIAWVAWLLMLGLELYLRLGPDAALWPRIGSFSLGYNLILTEFALVNLGVTALIVFRGWFERAPRAAVRKLGGLLAAVLTWLGVHFLLLLHVTGNTASPALALLPLIVLAAYVSLPARQAGLLTLGLLAGFAALQSLQSLDLIAPSGALAPAFADIHAGSGPAMVAVFSAIVLAWVLGRAVRRRLDQFGLAAHRTMMYDPLTHLFNRETLLRRLPVELRRAAAQGTPTALLLIDLRRHAQLQAGDDFEAASHNLQKLAADLVHAVRAGLDTPARYGPTTLAALLPTSGGEGAEKVARRLLEVWQRRFPDDEAAPASPSIVIGVGVAQKAAATTAPALLEAAGQALQAPEDAATGAVRVVEA